MSVIRKIPFTESISEPRLTILLTVVCALALLPQSAFGQVVAYDMVGSASQNLTSYTNPWTGAFTSAGDGFQKYQRGISPSIPFSVLDDSLSIFPADALGIIKEGNTDIFFGVTDTVNDDTSGPVSATWVFDISGASDLEISIDMGAMGDFESTDTFEWTYSIDGGPTNIAFSNSVDEAGSYTYILEGGGSFLLNDPMLMQGTILTNDLQTFSAPITGTGSSLTLTLTASTDGGSEAFAFQNIVIRSGGGGPPTDEIVINEIDYDQPSTDAAEFIELFNTGTEPVNLSAFSLELVNGSGGGASVYNTITLPDVELAPGDYFVVCGDAATVDNCNLDVSPDTNLIQNGSPDAVALRQGGILIDTVSYEGDTAAPYTEGSGAGLSDDSSAGRLGISRFPDGVDTDQNNVDLSRRCITPGVANTAADAECNVVSEPLEIFEIQGDGLASLFDGFVVTTLDNLVTATAPNGFFMQTPSARSDGNVDTSDGIFVFTGGAPGVAVGDLVDVTGEVDEFFGMTEFTSGSVVTVDSNSNALPPAVLFDAFVPSPDPAFPSCAIEFECYEGMLVNITDGTVTGPNQRFGTDPIAEVHITAASARTFRERGVEFPGLGMPPIPTWDGNPEVFELDPDKLGLPNMIIPAGSSFNGTGVLGFEFGGYEFWPSELSVTPAPLPNPVWPREPGEFTVATLNLFRLFDDVDDPPDMGRDDQVVSTAEYQLRLAKFSAHIREVLDAPDILAVQEAEKLGVLDDLAARIATDDPSVNYTAYLVEGNDVGTIDIGFMVRERIQVDAITQLGAGETYVNPITLEDDILHDRPPLLLEGNVQLEFGSSPIAVLAVHMRSLSGIDSPSEGERVRQKRFEQAESVATMVQDIQSANPDVRLIVAGDFNAFEFTDGYVDVVGIIKGDFDPAESLVCNDLTCIDIVEPNLTDEILNLPAEERYSFIFQGNGQVLDHALTSTALGPEISAVAFGRGNADAAFDLLNDDGTVADPALRSSDHDGLVLYILNDADNDGVPNDLDMCADTAIPEMVPTRNLGTNRWALVDEDGIFDTTKPNGRGTGLDRSFTLEDTAGCSCEQIIEALDLGSGHVKYGCSTGAMEVWIAEVSD